jgi:hypothetical protein
MKNLIKLAIVMVTISVSAHAINKKNAYRLINSCQYLIDNNKGKLDGFSAGYIIGLSKAYLSMLHESNIDNDFATMDGEQFSKAMCALTLKHRMDENEKSGGKYDVTEFAAHLELSGYMMATAIPKKTE